MGMVNVKCIWGIFWFGVHLENSQSWYNGNNINPIRMRAAKKYKIKNI